MTAEKKLHLAVLAQALIDILEEEEVSLEELGTALSTVHYYPALVRRLQKLSKEERINWLRDIERAMRRY